MKRFLHTAVLLLFLIFLFTGCGVSPKAAFFTSEDGTVSFPYTENADIFTSVDGDSLINLYRPDLFTLTVSVSGYAKDLEDVAENLITYYGKTGKELKKEADSVISGYPCVCLSVTGEGVSEGAVFCLISPVTGYYYEVFYTLSDTADAEVTDHVHTILNSLKLK